MSIHDLGRVTIDIGDRQFPLTAIRRKAAALLMFLVTRPKLTATREQVLDQLWPESDPVSGNNSLNQSLYFLRREIDPWFEDDVSVDYVRLQGDLVWLDADLSWVASAETYRALQGVPLRAASPDTALQLVRGYTGQFAPEFEYEEWAIAWRSRLHATFLSFANSAIETFLASGGFAAARDVAVLALEVAPDATEVETKLIKAYWCLGAHSAAAAQLAHLQAQYRSDGLEVPTLDEITGTP